MAMRRVNKGKLAGKASASAEALGLASLAAADCEGIAKVAMASMSDASAYVAEDGVVLACSASLLELTGLSGESVIGQPFKSLGQGVEEATRLSVALLEASREDGGVVSVQLRSEKSRALPAKVKLDMVDSGGVRRWLATMSIWIDGERRDAERFLSLPSNEFDSSTGMLGRAAFLRASAIAMHRDGFKDRPCLVCLDLDGFGAFNAKWGLAVGDAILEQLAERIKSQLRRGDLAGRMGSDEFCVYVGFAGNPNDAQAVAERIQHSISLPFAVAEGLEQVGATLGVSIGPRDGAGVEQLVCAAEAAIKSARARGAKIGYAG